MDTNLKLKFYYGHILGTVYAEGPSVFHKDITHDVVAKFVDPQNIKKDAYILDVGCGPGYFLDEMKERGYTNTLGISLSRDDVDLCKQRGHHAEIRDMNFLTERDESVDFIFARQSLEHSPFPYITLLEYNRVLKPNGLLYVEVPKPDCQLKHETNRNHFSVLGITMWNSLFERTGFDGSWNEVAYNVEFTDERGKVEERYYVFTLRRKRPVDVK